MPDTPKETRVPERGPEASSRRPGKTQIAAATGRMKEQRRAVKAIKERLAGAELTVPEIAAATGLPVSEVLGMWPP